VRYLKITISAVPVADDWQSVATYGDVRILAHTIAAIHCGDRIAASARGIIAVHHLEVFFPPDPGGIIYRITNHR
jgi:hypothetical protein